MPTALADFLSDFEPRFTDIEAQSIGLLRVDRWIASSLMQKAIRRGDVALAQRAAITLFEIQTDAVWRRLIVAAFEDVGAAAINSVVTTVAVCVESERRAASGEDKLMVAALARMMAEVPKDRSADYLIGAARNHPALAEFRQMAVTLPAAGRLAMVADASLPLPARAIASWYASGIEWGREKRAGKGNLSALLSTFRNLGVPEGLVTATGLAAARTREPITIMIPLLYLAVTESGDTSVIEEAVPLSPVVDGVPLYAFDMHTHIGKLAIRRFARESDLVRECLERYVQPTTWEGAVYNAAFYADAAPVARRLVWEQSASLEALGIENDLLLAGVSPEGFRPLLETVHNNLEHLNRIRASLFVQWQQQRSRS